MHKTVKLKSGDSIKVRVLELYELDKVPYDDPGEFIYNYVISGDEIKPVVHTLDDFIEVPERPELPRDAYEEGSLEHALWGQRILYEAFLTHNLKRLESAEQHAHDVIRYILENCIAKKDRALITTDDLDKILAAAIIQEVSLEHISHMLQATFQGALGWAGRLIRFAELAARQRRSDLNSPMGLPSPASVGA